MSRTWTPPNKCADGEHETDRRTEHLMTCRCGAMVCQRCGHWEIDPGPFCPACLVGIRKEIDDWAAFEADRDGRLF